MRATYDGTPVTLGGKLYIMPPLSLGQVKKIMPRLQELKNLTGVPSSSDADTMADIIHEALSRNYPDFDRSSLDDHLDMHNMQVLVSVAMTGSGLVLGNAPPVATPQGQTVTGGESCTGN